MIIDQGVMDRVENDIRELRDRHNITIPQATLLYTNLVAEELLNDLVQLLESSRETVSAGNIQMVLHRNDLLARYQYARELRYRYATDDPASP